MNIAIIAKGVKFIAEKDNSQCLNGVEMKPLSFYGKSVEKRF